MPAHILAHILDWGGCSATFEFFLTVMIPTIRDHYDTIGGGRQFWLGF